MEIKGTMDRIFSKVCKELLDHGDRIQGIKCATIELRNVTCEIEALGIITLPVRKFNLSYLEAEIKWYLSGELNPEPVAKLANIWNLVKDNHGMVNSNYGFIAMFEEHHGMSQLDWCVRCLSDDHASRQAVINFNQPRHKLLGVKDFPCCMYAQFFIRDGLLDAHIYFRSCDLVFGMCNDVPWFKLLQKIIGNRLNTGSGKFFFHASSLHIYPRHYKMAEEASKICDEGT